jgi:hypothetical protein
MPAPITIRSARTNGTTVVIVTSSSNMTPDTGPDGGISISKNGGGSFSPEWTLSGNTIIVPIDPHQLPIVAGDVITLGSSFAFNHITDSVTGGTLTDYNGFAVANDVGTQTIQELCHQYLTDKLEAILGEFGYTVEEDPSARPPQGKSRAVVIYDEYAMIAWPPTPLPADQMAQLPQLTLIFQPQAEKEFQMDRHISNYDRFEQEIFIGFTLTGSAGQVKIPIQDESSLGSLARLLKTTIITGLREDRTLGSIADDIRGFAAMPWAWGDGSGCGYGISFTLYWRTNYNDPYTR